MYEVRPASIAEIWQASVTVAPHIFRTPLRPALAASATNEAKVFLKLENWQPTGSFKVRGAVNFLSQLSANELQNGLVTASAGNHALAVSYAAKQLGITNVSVFVPRTAPRAKVEKLKRYPVVVREVGETYDDAHRAAEEFQKTTGATFIHAYDDVRTVAGAGTIGLEILEELPELDAVLVPVGGGGMISGIALAVKTLSPRMQVLAVQPAASPALRDSIRDNVCYEEYAAEPTLCDGLAGGIGKIVFEVARRGLIDDVLIVPEQSVERAIASLARDEQIIVEGSGAVGLAALECYPDRFAGKRIAIVISGANIDTQRLGPLIS